MFTGIIEEVGTVAAIEPAAPEPAGAAASVAEMSPSSDQASLADSAVLRIAARRVVEDAHHGDSIAVNGVCLTVVGEPDGGFVADVMKVTLDYTALGQLQVGDPVNLERAMSPAGRFGGHIVQGHVDGTARVIAIEPAEHWCVYRFQLDNPELDRYLVKKGSITLNGVSLTLAEVCDGEFFEVSLIPTTVRDTMLGTLAVGDRVNVECDVLAKYVEKMLQPHLGSGPRPAAQHPRREA